MVEINELYRRRAEILTEMDEIDQRETAANRNYLEADEYRTRATELERLGNQITVAESVSADRERRQRLAAEGRSTDDRAGLQEQRGGQQQQTAAGPFRSLGEQMQAVIRSMTPGSAQDQRLSQLRAATGQNEGVGEAGGFLVQHDMSSNIWTRVYNSGQIMSRVNRIPITSNANGIRHPYLKETSRTAGNRFGGIRTYRKAEAGTVASSTAKLGEFKLELETGMALVYLTDELMADAAQLEAYITQQVSQAITFQMEDEIINGNGVGRCLGILNAPSLVSVAKESGQAAATILPENIVKMRSRLFAGSRGNSIWLINQDVEPALHLMTKTDNAGTVYGYPTYMPANGLSSSPFDTLYGRPVVPVEHCATLGTVGDVIAADFSQYVLVEKGGVNVASSIHVQFIYGEQVLRFTWRNNGAPGYGWADGALTPAKGSNTQSPFVALATRA
jgi:HK97 family phage major capsid protein